MFNKVVWSSPFKISWSTARWLLALKNRGGVLISVFDQKIPIVTRDVAYGANAARLLQSLVLMKKPRKGGLPPVRHDPAKKVEKWIKLHEFVPRKLLAKATYCTDGHMEQSYFT